MNTPALSEKYPAPSLDLPWQQDIIALRRDFHTHPELAYEEVRTASVVAARLRALGLEVFENIGVTGVVGILRGQAGAGPCILVRADMDALPILEENEWEWKSSVAGKMHACGHDCHVATALTVARLMTQERSTLRGTIKFMFQPAEEGFAGAQKMMDDGLLEDGKFGPRPNAALGLHVWSDMEVGKVAVQSGPVMASADEFEATISGKGGHGALPHQTIDPVVVAAQIVLALQTTISRNLDPLQPGVVTVGKVLAGSAFNIIPGTAELAGTIRAFDPVVRATLERRCREIIEELPKAFGASSEWHFKRGYPPTVNDERITDIVRGALGSTLGEENLVPFTPVMGAEDFSLVLEKIPGCYFFVGGRSEAAGALYPHHHAKFNIDERALEIGARTMVATAKACLNAEL
jgi:amidohydrolase